MNLLPVDLATILPSRPLIGGRLSIVAGDLSGLVPGEIVSANLERASPGQAVLRLPGTTVTVQLPPAVAIDSHAPLLVRVSSQTASPSLEILGDLTPAGSNVKQTTVSEPRLRPRETVAAIVRQSADGQFGLEIGGRFIPLKSEGLIPGQSVLIRLGPPLAAASDSRLASETARPSAPLPPPLVRADVVNALPDGRFSVRIEGKTLTVAVDQPLPVGAKVLGRIESSLDGPVLRLDDPELASPSEVATAMLRDLPQRLPLGTSLQNLMQSIPQLLQSAGDDAPLARNIQQLQSLLTEMVASSNLPPSPDKLEQFVRDGGLHFEAKLARVVSGDASATTIRDAAAQDLKGQLLNVLSSAAESPSLHSAARLLEPVRQALDDIEAQQTLNVLARSSGEPIQIQFPLAAPGTWQTLQVSIQPDEQRSTSGERQSPGYNLLMHLDLSDLGATWIDAQASGKNLRTTLYIENEAGRARARTNIGQLNQALHEAGFVNVKVDVQAIADLPTGQAAERFHALEGSVPQTVSLVDRSA